MVDCGCKKSHYSMNIQLHFTGRECLNIGRMLWCLQLLLFCVNDRISEIFTAISFLMLNDLKMRTNLRRKINEINKGNSNKIANSVFFVFIALKTTVCSNVCMYKTKLTLPMMLDCPDDVPRIISTFKVSSQSGMNRLPHRQNSCGIPTKPKVPKAKKFKVSRT